MRSTWNGRLPWGIIIPVFFAICVMPGVARMQDIQTDTQVSAPRIAPGESMPVRVKLSNFGSNARSDVVLTYDVISPDGKIVHTENETYAVETTASFIHTLTLPQDIVSGHYTVSVSIAYTGQKSPAVASYPFTVERKIGGIFVSDLMLYGGIACASVLFASAVAWVVTRRGSPVGTEDYSDVPHEARIYYEVIGDIIRAMRTHEGDKALIMATQTPGLKINADTGRVLRLTEDPASVMAHLVREYEKQFGKRVNLAFGKNIKEHATVR